jgi:cytochrome P450
MNALPEVPRMASIDFDPFSLEYTANPRPLFARFHAEQPLILHEGTGSWFAHGYEEVRAFFNDPRFGMQMELVPGHAEASEERMQRWPVTEQARLDATFSDGPRHTRLRKLLAPDFKPSMIRKMSSTVADVVAKQCAPLQSEREVDIVELVQEVPLVTIARILGVDASGANGELFLKAAPDYFRGMNPLSPPELRDKTEQAAVDMYAVLAAAVAEHRSHPQDDLISQVLEVSSGIDDLSDKELIHSLVVLVAAGTDTTRLATSLAIKTLLCLPERLEELRADRSLLDNAIMELLRYDSPTKFTVRIASEDVEWKGQTIPRGAFVLLSPFAAGHDPAVYARPELFDPRRESRGLLTFGQGAHYCLGVHLAKSQIGAMLDFFLDHVPAGAELDHDGIEWSPQNMFLREVTRMPARLR